MFTLRVIRAALLAGGGISLAAAVALFYEGGHKTLTLIGWFVLAAALLVGGLIAWAVSHRRQQGRLVEPDSPGPLRYGYVGRPGSRANLGKASFGKDLDVAIDNAGDIDARGAKFGGQAKSAKDCP